MKQELFKKENELFLYHFPSCKKFYGTEELSFPLVSLYLKKQLRNWAARGAAALRPSHPPPPSAALPRGLLLGDVVAKVDPGISGTVGLVTVWAVVLALQRGAVPEEGLIPLSRKGYAALCSG